MFNRYVQLAMRGTGHARLLGRLTAAKIPLRRVSRTSAAVLSFSVRVKDRIKAIAISEEMCYTCDNASEKCRSNGIVRFCLPLAAMILTVLILASNFLIWRVEINCNEASLLPEVRRTVEQSGMRAFTFKSDRMSDLRCEIMALEKIAAASVVMDGNVLRVNVIGATKTTPVKGGGDVVSEYDGVVTRIVCDSGTAYARRGDVVRCGQTLIGGELTATADGSVIAGGTAKGSVYGLVTFSYAVTVSDGTSIQPTGNVYTSTEWLFRGMGAKESDCPYECYRTSVASKQLMFFTIRQTVCEELSVTAVSPDTRQYALQRKREAESVYSAPFDAKYIVEDNVLRLYLTAELCLGKS